MACACCRQMRQTHGASLPVGSQTPKPACEAVVLLSPQQLWAEQRLLGGRSRGTLQCLR